MCIYSMHIYNYTCIHIYVISGAHESQGAYNSYMKAVSTYVERKYLR